ncbi:hypothetical protein NQ015_05665 [Corynebacterium sp. 153RC1]|uniref:hypothetical protein n=1 Tax=unclassified Corynebacterium TaxID=2624378 RepID=UPI00211CBF7A|nr:MULTISPECIES: hypothetical protein [unclassified Corynebacterium]MCQ9352493.1 hypothetical protein [Corynebacterium sp. 209RC1]MCQ9354677.1 hypothetical protein [Corynebacterium sp. 1222RC1]MCQ9356788.1 hypothetical protein [Corynebacterium sp. 122RC1]MCQ9359008.1 hypothetical protein [Corynebacterium sp. 142RC1]MCQ9361256.1 hypothetical protein [Corynebacterium sp. 153RC1]
MALRNRFGALLIAGALSSTLAAPATFAQETPSTIPTTPTTSAAPTTTAAPTLAEKYPGVEFDANGQTVDKNGAVQNTCMVDWTATSINDPDLNNYSNNGYLSKVKNSLNHKNSGGQEEPGNFELQHWVSQNRDSDFWRFVFSTQHRILNPGQTLTLTAELPSEGYTADTSATEWLVTRYYGGSEDVRASSLDLPEQQPLKATVTVTGKTLTAVFHNNSTDAIEANSAIAIVASKAYASSQELLATPRIVTSHITGTNAQWDPVAAAAAKTRLLNGTATKVDDSAPDCFRQQTTPRSGDKTERCEVDWNASAYIDRRFVDWTNNGYIEKIRPASPYNNDGTMEVQHFLAGDRLYIRIPVGTTVNINNPELTVSLPDVGKQWQIEPNQDRTFLDPTDHAFPYEAENYIGADVTGTIDGDTATYTWPEGADFKAGQWFTLTVSVPMTAAELDELTLPDLNTQRERSDLSDPTERWDTDIKAFARLTGELDGCDPIIPIPIPIPAPGSTTPTTPAPTTSVSPAQQKGVPRQLAATGASVVGLLAVAAGLVAAGVFFTRRNRNA